MHETVEIAGIAFRCSTTGMRVHPAQIRAALQPLEALAVFGRLNEMDVRLADSGIPLPTVRRAVDHVQARGGIAPRVDGCAPRQLDTPESAALPAPSGTPCICGAIVDDHVFMPGAGWLCAGWDTFRRT